MGALFAFFTTAAALTSSSGKTVRGGWVQACRSSAAGDVLSVPEQSASEPGWLCYDGELVTVDDFKKRLGRSTDNFIPVEGAAEYADMADARAAENIASDEIKRSLLPRLQDGQTLRGARANVLGQALRNKRPATTSLQRDRELKWFELLTRGLIRLGLDPNHRFTADRSLLRDVINQHTPGHSHAQATVVRVLKERGADVGLGDVMATMPNKPDVLEELLPLPLNVTEEATRLGAEAAAAEEERRGRLSGRASAVEDYERWLGVLRSG